MAKYNLTKTTWSPISAGTIQATKRIQIASSASPADGDWITVNDGGTLLAANALYARAVDKDAHVVVINV